MTEARTRVSAVNGHEDCLEEGLCVVVQGYELFLQDLQEGGAGGQLHLSLRHMQHLLGQRRDKLTIFGYLLTGMQGIQRLFLQLKSFHKIMLNVIKRGNFEKWY